MKRAARRILVLILMGVVWTIGAWLFSRPAIFPGPLDVGASFVELFQFTPFASDIVQSLVRVIVGYTLGVSFALLVGLGTGSLRVLDEVIGTPLSLLRPLPPVALVPFAILFFGFGLDSQIFLVFWGSFFPVWMSTHWGTRAMDPKLVWVAQSLGASKRDLLFRVIAPGAARTIFPSLRTAVGSAYICLLAAEMAGASSGIAYRMLVSQQMFRMDQVIAVLIVITLLGFGSDWGLGWFLRRRFPWYRGNEGAKNMGAGI